jgi:hypothetical protein
MKISTQVALFVSFTAGCSFGQTVPQSAADLIRYLSYQSERTDKHGIVRGMGFSCGPSLAEDRDNRALARALIGLGVEALPDLEEAITSLEAQGGKSPTALNAGWWLLAYASIKGPAAADRLKRLYGRPGLEDYALSIDNAIALAHSLTSFVSAFRDCPMEHFHQCREPGSAGITFGPDPCAEPKKEVPILHIRCDRGEEPRDVLDQLILAWEIDHRSALEASLGPVAKAALAELLRDKTWAQIRGELWPAGSASAGGAGYKFHVQGRWSEADENFSDEGKSQITIQREPSDPGPKIDTSFKTITGAECGRIDISFSESARAPSSRGPVTYAVDNANLADVLRLIARCALAK